MKKPLVEAMAQAYVAEAHRLDSTNSSWDDLPVEEQNLVMMCMTEVARTVGYFEKKGMVFIAQPEPKKKVMKRRSPSRDLPRDPTDEQPLAAALDPMTTQGEAGTLQRAAPPVEKDSAGWMLCDICGQVAVVRESACRTRCQACGAIDGGCG
jgi:hypothetical protein